MGGQNLKMIMIIEDDEAIQTALVELIESAGYGVVSASDGQEALNILRHENKRPSMILLDLSMPVMDGFEFRREQLSDPVLKDIPAVIMTADGRVGEKGQATAAKAFLKKPLTVESLLATIENIVGRTTGETP